MLRRHVAGKGIGAKRTAITVLTILGIVGGGLTAVVLGLRATAPKSPARLLRTTQDRLERWVVDHKLSATATGEDCAWQCYRDATVQMDEAITLPDFAASRDLPGYGGMVLQVRDMAAMICAKSCSFAEVCMSLPARDRSCTERDCLRQTFWASNLCCNFGAYQGRAACSEPVRTNFERFAAERPLQQH